MMLRIKAISASLLGAVGLFAQQPCENLTKLALPHTAITSAVSVAATPAIPAHCDVKATALAPLPIPKSTSSYGFLPSGWNGQVSAGRKRRLGRQIHPRSPHFPNLLSAALAVAGNRRRAPRRRRGVGDRASREDGRLRVSGRARNRTSVALNLAGVLRQGLRA